MRERKLNSTIVGVGKTANEPVSYFIISSGV
ncbi:hypothetical protein CLMAG_33280 [Clostridium magnum DSM 2767]|uniref:Uncharacterized protein n=1 Tax=Clostridium magnum DSM 2767 TaxID=1121326 RepID=A0A168DWY6_9CLOT|nr:hypothetical protein CLMAG_33280 [Clostridium magnum DSM 2767]